MTNPPGRLPAFSRPLVHSPVLSLLALVTTLALGGAATSRTDWRRLLPTVSGDLAITKERAERGDVPSQLELANKLAAKRYTAEAVGWYRKAAEKGVIEAKFRLGEILLGGTKTAANPDQCVAADPAEGILLTFEAATNFYSPACLNMAKAMEQGLGVGTNWTEAYAWLQLYAISNLNSARAEMDQMALRMDLKDIRLAQTAAEQFKARQWPHLCVRRFSEAELTFKLSGITVGPVSIAIINGKMLEEGGKADFSGKEGVLHINCLKINQESVLIAVDGESDPRILRMP